jgi:predicted NAD/FAD-binding protein
MPKRRRAWASWNFHLDDPGAPAAERTAVTYWMNNLQRLDAERDYFVSLNLDDRIGEDSVIETISYDHPVITHASVSAQARWDEISGADRVHFCGAYWRWGFHEDGCWSAIRACQPLLAATAESLSGDLELAA